MQDRWRKIFWFFNYILIYMCIGAKLLKISIYNWLINVILFCCKGEKLWAHSRTHDLPLRSKYFMSFRKKYVGPLRNWLSTFSTTIIAHQPRPPTYKNKKTSKCFIWFGESKSDSSPAQIKKTFHSLQRSSYDLDCFSTNSQFYMLCSR